MAQLYFRYGAMAAGKSSALLQAAYNYKNKGMGTLLLTSGLDTRSSTATISSRIGISAEAVVIADGTEGEDYLQSVLNGYVQDPSTCPSAIFVDECQFLSKKCIDILSDIVDTCDIPVLCYGIRTNFESGLFVGSQRLFEIADKIEELKHICSCGRKATMNAILIDSTETILPGGDDVYQSMCRSCFKKFNSEKDKK